jgi:hypothetical protein
VIPQKQARVQNPDKDEGEVRRRLDSGELIRGGDERSAGGHAVVGAWRLLSWENRAADGQVTYPMGTDVVGYLLYTADGRFSVLISRAGRTGFAVGDLLSGTTEEKARAVEGFVAYGGPLQLPWRPGGASRGTVVVPQLGRRQPRAVGRAYRGSADPQRQAAAAGGQTAGAPPGLGTGRPLAGGRLTLALAAAGGL